MISQTQQNLSVNLANENHGKAWVQNSSTHDTSLQYKSSQGQPYRVLRGAAVMKGAVPQKASHSLDRSDLPKASSS